ncbi:hypothetical protein HNR59_002864 [Aquamicrobium lusatiense]|uniref:Uncharacterized protein n=1 Tax=Aquamicrobium lusatiense TaxID=89772 RepID=A0A7W9S3T2_9HYPH|nr:hypothetical protein [Aquamicrobium lusatiense]MBB6013475.1 hypothetical protein [Aquamicrobium lusatiense]
MAFPDFDPVQVFRDFVTDKVPSSGKWNPRKPEIRRLLKSYESAILALIAGQGGDIELARGVISFAVTGGTANDIVAEPDSELPDNPGSAVYILGGVLEPNTGNVTINGKPLLTNSGNQIASGGLVADGIYLFLDDGANYRLLSDYASAAIVAAAEAQAERAETAATEAALYDPTFRYKSIPDLLSSMRAPGGAGTVWQAGEFLYEEASTGATDHHVETAAGVKLYVLPDQQGAYAATAFGVSSAVADNTTIYNRIIAGLPANSKIVWPDKQTLLGHFLSPGKVFDLDLNGSTLVNTLDNQSIVQMGHSPRTAYDVTEVVLQRGARSFTVVGASSLFASGHIGYLWDSAVRPGGTQGVNYEVIKIDRVEGNTVYLQWPLYSYKGAGALKFYYSPVQHKNASIRNGKAHPTNTHIGMGFSVWNCDGVDFDRHRSENTSGRAFDCRYSINFSSNDTICDRPRSSGSGEGYGLALYAVTGVRVRKAHGYRCRHAYDQDSVYDFDVSDVYDPEDQSSCCALAHNGFASDGYLENVRSETSVTSGVYAVVLSAQGYGRGANEAKAENHCFYNVYIDGVQYDARLPLLATAARMGVYAQNSISGRIANVRLDHEDTTNPTSVNANGVRINGVPCGDLELSQIGGKRLGAPIFLEEVEYGPAGKYVARIRGITVDEACWVAIFSRGSWSWSVDGINLNAVLGPGVIQSGTHFSHLPVRYDIGSSLSYSGADVPIISHGGGAARPTGSKALSPRSISSAVAVVDGASISTAQLENRDMRLVLSSPSGAGSITLSATTALPQPAVNGAQAYVSVPAGLNDVVFPAGNNIHAGFTIAAGSAVRLVSYSNKWALA